MCSKPKSNEKELKMIKVKIAFITSIFFLITGCGVTQKMSNEASSFEQAKSMNDTKGSDVNVIFYRMEGNKNNVAVAKIGERVAGSILPNAYAYSKVCMDKIYPGVAQRGGAVAVTKYLQPIDVNNTECMFFKINEANDGSFSLLRVSCENGKKDVETINRKSKVINRHLPDCKVPVSNKNN